MSVGTSAGDDDSTKRHAVADGDRQRVNDRPDVDCRISRRHWLLGCGSALALSGCGLRGLSVDPAALTLQLNWLPDAQHGGFYAAIVNGLFEQRNLGVSIRPGGPDVATLPKLVLGQVDFAIANADQILLARAQQADVVAVFAAMQNSPRCIMVHAASGIQTWEDLQGISLALGEGKAFAEYLKRRLSLTDVRIVPYTGDISKWMVDPQFAQQAYVFSEPILAAHQGGDPLTLLVSDLGFNPYTSVLVTRRDVVDQHAQMVSDVVEAVRSGWQSYLTDPEAANRAILTDNTAMDLEVLNEGADAIKPLCLAGLNGQTELGRMTTTRWEKLQSQLLEMRLLDQPEADVQRVFVNL